MIGDCSLFLEGRRTNTSSNCTSIRDLFLDIFSSNEDQERICAIFNEDQLTASQLSQNARKIATSLANYTIVAVCMHPSLELITTLCGIILRGIPYVPLEPTLPYQRLKYILNDSEAQLIIRSDFSTNDLNFEGIDTFTYSQLCVNAENDNKLIVKVNSEDTFCLMYTSGSTGQPKGVHLSHRALLNRLHWQWSNFPFDNDVCCLKTSISFVDSIAEIFSPLLQRVPIVILPKSLLMDIAQLTHVLAMKHITRIVLVPSLLTILIDYLQNSNNVHLFDLRFVICSGETLSLHLIESFFNLKMKKLSSTCCLLNLYGSTEVMADVTCEIFKSTTSLYDTLSYDGRTSIGFPIDNIRIDIIEPDERGVGELVVKGQGVANEYHKCDTTNTILSNKFTCDDDGQPCFFTGDLGKIIYNRIIYYGRKDNQIKISGNRIDLSEIELVLKQYYNCRQPVAIYVPTNAIIVVFLQEMEEPIDLNRISLEKHLPLYAIPSQFITVPEIPLLVSGKIDRQFLLNSLNTIRQREQSEDKQEESENVRSFFQVFQEIGISRKNTSKSFLAAGGTSLNALLVINKLHHIGFHDITVEDLFNASTLQQILLHSTNGKCEQQNRFFAVKNEYQIVSLDRVDKDNALHIIIESFANLNELDALLHYNRDDLKLEYKQQLYGLLDQRWSFYTANGLSFGIIRNDGRLVGISLSNNLAEEPYIDLKTIPILIPVFDMMEANENELLEKLRKIGALSEPIFHNFLNAVNSDLEPMQRVAAMHFLEQQALDIAAINQFRSVLTANVGSVSQQLANYVLKYDINKVVNVSEWRNSSGTLMFPHANKDHIITINFKHITYT